MNLKNYKYYEFIFTNWHFKIFFKDLLSIVFAWINLRLNKISAAKKIQVIITHLNYSEKNWKIVLRTYSESFVANESNKIKILKRSYKIDIFVENPI